jgi:nicotinamide-nucleotide amidase
MKIEKIVKKLIKKNITISTAESCTGGLIASEITKVPNSSKIFNLGLVTYSNSSKNKILKINKKIIKKYGAVSLEICKEMVKNLYKISKTKICISVTGIAGPSGGSLYKPVGLVFIGFKFKNTNKVFMFNFNKKFNRKKIQKLTCKKVFEIINLNI